jgi:hypothetical protein
VKDIPGYPGYHVSNYGEVYTSWVRKKGGIGQGAVIMAIGPTMKRLKAIPSDSRWIVGLRRNGQQKLFKVATLVLMTFVGPRPHGMEACHFPDRNTANNRLDNLRWDTHSSNQRDRISHGTSNAGERNGSAKLSEAKVRELIAKRQRGWTCKKLATRYGISLSCVYQICNGILWKCVGR